MFSASGGILAVKSENYKRRGTDPFAKTEKHQQNERNKMTKVLLR
jgi:hypothetical protein